MTDKMSTPPCPRDLNRSAYLSFNKDIVAVPNDSRLKHKQGLEVLNLCGRPEEKVMFVLLYVCWLAGRLTIMRTYTVYCLFLLRSIALAQDLFSAYPQCAVACLGQYVPQTSCGMADIPCLCTNQQLWENATVCAMVRCTTRETLTTQRLAKTTCNAPMRNRSSALPIVSTVMTSITAVFLLLRVIARSPRRFELMGWDDGFIILCFFTGLPLTASHFYLAKNGIGQDIWEVPFHNIDQMLFWFYIGEPFYLASTVLMKISILMFYLRVFIDQWFRRTVYLTIGLCIAYAIAFLFPLIFQCSPIAYAWTHWDSEAQGKCISLNIGVWSHAASNILFDLVVLFLPIRELLKLKFTYTWRSKAQIGVMFGIGLLVTIISGVRLGELVRFANTINPTWDYWGAALWSGVEVWTGVICACLPTARVFVSRMLPKWLGMSYSRSAVEHGQPAKISQKFPSKHIMSWKSSYGAHGDVSRMDDGANFAELKSLEGFDDFRPGRAL